MSYVETALFQNILNETTCPERVGIVEETKLPFGEIIVGTETMLGTRNM